MVVLSGTASPSPSVVWHPMRRQISGKCEARHAIPAKWEGGWSDHPANAG